MRKIDEWLSVRSRNAAILHNCFSSISAVRVTVPPEHVRHAFYRYYVFVRPEQLRQGWSRDRIANEIAGQGIACFSGSCSEIYLEKAFDATGFRPHKSLEVAHLLGETSLAFLVHPTLSVDHMLCACDVIKEVFEKASR
jgi:hypothetical protein